MDKLKPCPFNCSDNETELHVVDRHGAFLVMCGCGAMGPAADGIDAAKLAWNRRTTDAAVAVKTITEEIRRKK